MLSSGVCYFTLEPRQLDPIPYPIDMDAPDVNNELTRVRPSRQYQHGDDDDDECIGNTDLDNKEGYDVEDPTGPSSLQPATRSEVTKMYCSNTTVSWTDGNGDMQSTDSLDLDIAIDHTSNTAFLRLCGDIYIKCSNPSNRRVIYLYIRPEVINSVSFRTDNKARSLCFSLQRKPDLITPKEPINAKLRSQALLDAIMVISAVTNFTVRLNSSDTTPSKVLKKVAFIFSPRPTWNAELGNLDRLYDGSGGQIANAGIAVSTVSTVEASTESEDSARTDSEAQSPPAYRPASSKPIFRLRCSMPVLTQRDYRKAQT